MSANWKQVFDANPTTIFQANDIFYLARSPYGVGQDFAFTYSSLASQFSSSNLTNTHIFVGNAGNVATDVALSGDATLLNTGVLTLANTAVTPAAYTVNGHPLFTVDSKGRLTAASSASVLASDITGSALTSNNDTNVTATLGGSPNTALLNAASLTLGWIGQLALSRGGTNANLTASDGGVVYSTPSALNILPAPGAINKALVSSFSGAPHWTATSYPDVMPANSILYSNSTPNVVTVNTATANTVLISDGSNSINFNQTLPSAVQSNITTVGNVTSGTWSGTTIGVTHGGTGTTTQFTPGSVVFADGSGIYNQDTANFFWDSTNHRLGIGTSSPSQPLSLNGIFNIFDSGGASFPAGAVTELNAGVLNNGINDNRFGTQVVGNQGGFQRFDTRAGQPVWGLFFRKAGDTGVYMAPYLATSTTTGRANFALNGNSLFTNETDGFAYMVTMAGTPTGVPTSLTGLAPFVYDSANNIFYVYNSGWNACATSTSGTFVVTATGFTVVGTPTYTGNFSLVGKTMKCVITAVSTVSIAAMAGTSYFTGMPNNPFVEDICGGVTESFSSLGNGIVTTAGRVYVPTIASTSSKIVISFSYQIA